MRRVGFVRVVLGPNGVSCEAVGMGHRLPTRRPVSLATAAALATQGVRTVVRSETGRAASDPVAG